MPSFEFEVWCGCGEGLCNQSSTRDRWGSLGVTVEPCPRCLESAIDKARDEGYSLGWDEGYKEGWQRAMESEDGER